MEAKFQELYSSEVCGKDVSRVVIAINVVDVDYPLVIHFADIVIADVNVLGP